MHIHLALAGSLKAAVLVGAAVSAATLVYLIDRAGWVFGLLLGWAPALLMGLAAAIGHFVLALIVQAPSRRRQGVRVSEDAGLAVPSAVPIPIRPLTAATL